LLPSFACPSTFCFADALGRRGDEQLLALRQAALDAEALLALQADFVLWR
jgi:hypothetical protein